MRNIHETILYVNLNILGENLKHLKSKLHNDTKVIAVVKAFAYGLGDVSVAKHLEKIGVYAFWVADFEEGVQLRKGGIISPIIVANPGSKSLESILTYQLEPVIYNQYLLDLYAENKRDISIHLKFNTGMNRYGFNQNEIDEVISKLNHNSNLKVKSICSHLSASNEPLNDVFSKNQMKNFNSIRLKLEKKLNYIIPFHIMNSNGVIRFNTSSNEWVRLGIALYGGIEHPELKQIFSLKSVISQLRNIKSGESVGYQNSFKAYKAMKIAIIPVGYADGLNRKLGNQKSHIFINDRACEIIGEISMDSFAADVTGLNVVEGQEVVIFSPKYSVSKLADNLSTIPYEIMATLNRRIKRVYLKE